MKLCVRALARDPTVQKQAGNARCPVPHKYTRGFTPSKINYPDVFENICSLSVCDPPAAGAQHPRCDRGLCTTRAEAPISLEG